MFRKNKLIYQLLTMQKQGKLTLTPKEEEIFKMLMQYRNQMQLDTVLRVAGGWVRDKLMGKQSNDIDIALDNMKGEEFVTKLKNHAKNKMDDVDLKGFGITKFNPQMSKHLETATIQIKDRWIDFVNLRSETYNENSRIPIIVAFSVNQEIGTPKEDAERRDFTINSMFYNLNTNQVQDWTQRGFADLEQGILRTPLEPYVTFKDDPLRILRCLRFKARFNFLVQESIYKAMEKEDIKCALLNKVSRQRIGTELEGLMKAKHPEEGLADILKYGLWNIVFKIPEDSNINHDQGLIAKIPETEFTLFKNYQRSINHHKLITEGILTLQDEEPVENKKSKKYSPSDLQIYTNLAILTYVYYPYEVKVGKTSQNLTQYMIKDQLKYCGKKAKFAVHLCQAVYKLQEIINLQNLSTIVRWVRFAEEKWELALHLLWALQQSKILESNLSAFELRQFILDKKIHDCYLVQAPVNGNFFKSNGIKGRDISRCVENSVIWKILNEKKTHEQFIEEFQKDPHFFMNQKTYQ